MKIKSNRKREIIYKCFLKITVFTMLLLMVYLLFRSNLQTQKHFIQLRLINWKRRSIVLSIKKKKNKSLQASLFLPVFTWYFRVIEQSNKSCWRVSPVSGTSRSSRRIISAGWWKSRTFAFLSFVALTKSSKISITFIRNSLVAG